MSSPAHPGPDLPLSFSSASSSEEEDEEGEEDHEEEDFDEEDDGIGEGEADVDVTPVAAKTLAHDSFPSLSSSSSGRQNGSVSARDKRKLLSREGVAEGETKRTRSSSSVGAVKQEAPISGSVPLPTEVPPGDSSEIEEKAIVNVGEDSRRLFQRLWTDEDEIGLLNGFYEYSRRGNQNSHDMTPFYEQIKAALRFDYNKNQLVEKLRRLKKKYRNVVQKLNSGKDFAFKSMHDQLTFEISKKIWDADYGPVAEDEDEPVVERKAGRVSRRSQAQASLPQPSPPSKPAADGSGGESVGLGGNCWMPPVHSMVEETVRNCLSPIFKELMHCAANGPSHLGFGVGANPLPLSSGEFKAVGSDERWRKQQILELEVYLKRIELVQEHIKSTLHDLRSMGT